MVGVVVSLTQAYVARRLPRRNHDLPDIYQYCCASVSYSHQENPSTATVLFTKTKQIGELVERNERLLL